MTTTLSEFGIHLHKMTEENVTANGNRTEPGKQFAALEAQRHNESQQLLCKLQAQHVEHMMQTEELCQRQIVLEASRTRYFSLFDLAPVGYLILNSSDVILEANLAVATMHGMDRNDLLENMMSKFIFHEDQHDYRLRREKRFDVGELQGWEMRMVRSDGSPFWARLQATRVLNGETWITLVDITERKQAEEKLRQWMWRVMPAE